MNSCDTFALTAGAFTGGKNILCKNSDRPLGEAQPMQIYPRRTYRAGEMLACTNLTIPQVEITWAVLGCQPYWIWGFEMGVNEWGLAIGNEAQGSRCEAETVEGMLGMDLLRLGLERAKTAREAITVITELLERYGQNSNASQLFDRRYENSFMLVDPQEIWLLETAGRQWVAKQVHDRAAISNCYSIESDFDMCSRDVSEYARSRKWLAPDERFNFAKAYTAPAVRQTASNPRWRRLLKLIHANPELTEADCKAVLRDHFEGEIMEPRFGGAYGMFVTICMHAMTWDASQTTCSLLASWDEDLGMVCRYAPSIPCCSAYIPVYMLGPLPSCLTLGGAEYDPNSLWWQTERLAMAISIDEERFCKAAREALRIFEAKASESTANMEIYAREQIQKGNGLLAKAALMDLTAELAAELLELVGRIGDRICREVADLGGLYGPRKEFLEDYCRRVKMSL